LQQRHAQKTSRYRSQTNEFNVLLESKPLDSIEHELFLVDDNSDDFIIDSGATTHVVKNKAYFVNYIECLISVKIGNGNTVLASGKGTIKIPCLVDGRIVNNIFPDALYIPTSPRNILSYARLRNCGVTSTDSHPKQWVFYLQNGKKLMESIQKDNVFIILTKSEMICFSNSSQTYLEHSRLGHVGHFDGCDVCSLTKLTRKPFPHKSETHPAKIGDIIVSDVWGPFSIQSPSRSKYYVSFIDVNTRYSWVYFMKEKSEVLTKFKDFHNMVNTQFNAKIKVFRSDGGGEYCSKEFDSYLAAEGILRQKTAPYSPQQNGIAERFNQTLLTIVRSIKHGTNFPNFIWTEAVATANSLRNMNVTSATGKSPHECLYGNLPDLTRLRRFACKVFVTIPQPHRKNKTEDVAVQGAFVGYDIQSKAYRFGFQVNKN
jgi:hypothetical protein